MVEDVRATLPLLMLLGCAPPLHMRPMSPPYKDRTAEVGTALAAVGPRPAGQDEWAYAQQAWATWPRGSIVDLSVIGVFDGDRVAGGLGLRVETFRNDYVGVGLGMEVGSGWVAIEVPLAVNFGDRVALYTSPQVGTWGVDQTVRFPVGVDVRVVDAFSMRGEAQLNYPDYDPYKRRYHMGLGVAWQL